MKRILFSLALLLAVKTIRAQNVVRWSFSAKKIADKTYEVHLTPTVQSPWHIYSQTSPEGGALPTKFNFNKNPLTVLEGGVRENGKLISKYEEVFEVTVKYFEGKADFVQLVKLKANAKTIFSGSVEFMVCNDVQCLPPQIVPFSIPLQ